MCRCVKVLSWSTLHGEVWWMRRLWLRPWKKAGYGGLPWTSTSQSLSGVYDDTFMDSVTSFKSVLFLVYFLSLYFYLLLVVVFHKVLWKTPPTWSAHPTPPGTVSRRHWRWERPPPRKFAEQSLVRWRLWTLCWFLHFPYTHWSSVLPPTQAGSLTASETASTKSSLSPRRPGEWWSSSSLKFTLRSTALPTGRRRVYVKPAGNLHHTETTCDRSASREASHGGG